LPHCYLSHISDPFIHITTFCVLLAKANHRATHQVETTMTTMEKIGVTGSTTHGALAKIATGITAILLLLWVNFSMTILVDGYAFEPASMALITVSTSSPILFTTRSFIPVQKHQGGPKTTGIRLLTNGACRASRHYQRNNFCRNPTSTALPLYLDSSQSLSAKNHQKHNNPHQSPSSLSYRIDNNVDEQIFSLVEGIYKNNNQVMKNDENFDHGVSPTQQKKSYLLLIGVEEESPKAHHPPLANPTRQPYRSFLTLMSTEGMMERHRLEYGLQPHKPDSPGKSPLLVPAVATLAKRQTYNQRISFFEGGEPFFSLSNLEYGVSTNVIKDAAGTGLFVAFMVMMSVMHPFAVDNYHYYPSETSVNNAKLISSLVLSVPAATAYLSITRSSVGSFTRTMSTFWMNWMSLVVVSSIKATEIVADGSRFVEDIIIGTIPTNLTANDVTAPPVPELKANSRKSQGLEYTEPVSSIPVLIGELVWYSSLAVVQQTKNFFSKTTDSILNYQVNMIRNNRLQIQERKQRNLLEAQIRYTNIKKQKRLPLTKQHEQNCLLGTAARSSGVMTKEYVPPSSKNEHAFLLGDSERDDILNTATTLHLHGNIVLTYLDQNSRVDDINSGTFLHENLFQLGENEREHMSTMSMSHQLLGNIEFAQSEKIMIEKDDAHEILPEREGLFHLGQLERDETNIRTKNHHFIGNVENTTQKLMIFDQNEHLFQLGQEERDDLNASVKTHHLLGNIEYAPQNLVAPRQGNLLFQLGQEERDDLLLGNLENVTQNPVAIQEGDMVSPRMHLFYLGHNNRGYTSTRNVTMQNFSNNELGQETILTSKVDESTDEQYCLDQEAQELANVHRLIQERARSETKKRLHTLAESKLLRDDEVVKPNEFQVQMKNKSEANEVASSSRTLKLKRSWKSLSHKVGKVKNYLKRQGKMNRSDRYTMVQRGALYLVAATSSLFVNFLRQPSSSSHDETASNAPVLVSNKCE
jgi:hypothetical protein